jgi:glucose-1-phosphate thymidylyltransferase
MKGLILCGGKGTRMRPFSYTGVKHFLPVANKPVICYIIESMKRAGIKEIYIVTGAADGEFRYKLGDGGRWGVSITYIVQHRPLGLANGVKISKEYLSGDAFVTVLGDNLIAHSVEDILRIHNDTGADSTILLSPVECPERFGIATLENGKITKLVEKPKKPASNYAVIGMYVFNGKIFDAIEKIKPSARGEYELTDAIMEMIRGGDMVGYKLTGDWWIDVGRPEDLLEANKRMLGDIQRDIGGQMDLNSKIADKVIIGENSVIADSIIDDCVVIGKNVVVQKSHIGPYTAIGDGSRLTGIRIKNSIVMEDCVLDGVFSGIDMSIIGRGSTIKISGQQKNISIWVGQDSTIKGV